MNDEVKLITAIPVVALGIIFAATAHLWPWTAERFIGLLLAVFGVVMLTIARFNLGSSFSVTPQAKQLVTRGVYSRIQHPVYVFAAIILAGIVLYFGRPIFLLFLIVLVPIQIVRAHKESTVLEEKFGDEYREWKRTTWF